MQRNNSRISNSRLCFLLYVLVAEWMGIRNLIFGYLESSKKWIKGKLNKAFFIFSFFAIFDDLSKFRRTFCILHFQKLSNMAKKLARNEENPCSTCLKPTALRVDKTCVSGTRHPFCH